MRQSVIIIDDSQDTHLLVKARLKGEPVDLLYASDGKAGIEAAREHLPNLILLDVDMPHTDGFEVCQYSLNMRGMSGDNARREAERVLAEVGLTIFPAEKSSASWW